MKLNIRNKLYGGFGTMIILLVIAAVISYISLTSVADSAKEIKHSADLDEATMTMIIRLQEGMDVESQALITGWDDALTTQFDELEASFEEEVGVLNEIGNDAIKAQVADVVASHDEYHASVLTTFALVQEGDPEAAKANSLEVTDTAIEATEAELDALEDVVMGIGVAALESADSQKNTSTMMVIAVAVIAVVIGAALAFWIARNIVSGISLMVKAAEGISVGDLQQNVDVKSNDEIGEMANSFKRMIAYLTGMAEAAEHIAEGDLTAEVHAKSEKDALGNAFAKMIANLRGLIGNVNETVSGLGGAKDQLAQSADQASQASQQIASTTSQVAQGTSQQASSAQEVSQSVEQLSKAIEQVAQGAQTQAQSVGEADTLSQRVASGAEQVATNAEAAAEGARSASETAQNGAAMVQNTIEGMGRIKGTVEAASEEISKLGERSAEIGKIVAVIDDIAAQTNLLALNAAIEAARAGEQGRGFAVVADEVRQLAERVATATKEIADLIGGVQQGVDASVKAMADGATEMESGTKVAADAGAAIQQILSAVESVNEQIQQIASGSQDLKASGTEMTASVASIRSVVEQNTAASEEMQASSATVSQAISGIAGVAEENSSATQQVSASAQEMNAQVEEVTAATHTLGEMAEALAKQVAQFRLNGAGNGNGKQTRTQASEGAAAPESPTAV